ncbi:MAG: alanine racemase [Pseudomonadota bacterium]
MSLRPRATIHLSNIADNWRRLNALSGQGGAGAVVKADAYGHGAARVSRVLAAAGCEHFFVAYGFEGVEVREAVGDGPAIYVFNGGVEVDTALARSAKLIPVINSVSELTAWLDQAGDLLYALHVDTGMNRLGVRPDEVASAASLMGNCPPCLLMTHFACADTPDASMSATQLGAFEVVAMALPRVPISLANSAAHWLPPKFRAGLTRPGIALYGGGNSPARPDGLKPGLTLTAPILQVQSIPSGETVGYGATRRTDTPTLVATAALGYADGFPRSASNSGFAYLGETRCPVIGRVSMDLITLDVSAAAPLAKPGALVEVIGARADLEEQAAAAGTLGYELITGLGPRVERIYED